MGRPREDEETYGESESREGEKERGSDVHFSSSSRAAMVSYSTYFIQREQVRKSHAIAIFDMAEVSSAPSMSRRRGC